MEKVIKKSDFIQSLEKGLKVITAFDNNNEELTLTDVAKKVGLTRANARRVLLTLEYLGYAKSRDNKMFSLTPKVLSLGYSFLSSLSFRELAQPYMQELASEVQESCSMSVLEENQIVYIARVHTKRIMTIALGIGTRLPVHATSMGKVLLASKTDKEIEAVISNCTFDVYTSHTISNREKLLIEINKTKKQGWALANQELELGVRSIACPIKDKSGKTIAALNISGHAGRVSLKEMREKFLPKLQHSIKKIEDTLKSI